MNRRTLDTLVVKSQEKIAKLLEEYKLRFEPNDMISAGGPVNAQENSNSQGG